MLYLRHQISAGCTDPFVSKLTPTSPSPLTCSCDFPAEASPTGVRGLLVGPALAGKRPAHTPTILLITPLPVGASLLASALSQTSDIRWMYRPLREQAHSHKSIAPTCRCGLPAEASPTGVRGLLVGPALAGKRPAHTPTILLITPLPVGASLLANALPQRSDIRWMY